MVSGSQYFKDLLACPERNRYIKSRDSLECIRQILYKDDNSLDVTVSWDLTTQDGTDTAYGVYVYYVDAPGVGEKTGKFALIK